MTAPGRGCGCELCARPVPVAPPKTVAEALALNRQYEQRRQAHRVLHPIIDTKDIDGDTRASRA